MSDPIAPALPEEVPAPQEARSVVQVSSEAASLLAALPPPQRKVLLRLTNGASIAQAAYGSGVCRMTVYRWIKKSGPFHVAYERWRQELVESAQTRLLHLLDEAVDAVQSAVLDGNVEVALELLRTLGPLRKPKHRRAPIEAGETDETP